MGAWELIMVKKDNTYRVGPYNVEVIFDYSNVKERYDNWKDRCEELSGEDIGVMREETSLWDSLLKHGNSKRIVYGKGGEAREAEQKKSGQGGSYLLPACNTIFGGDMGPQTKELLQSVKNVMDNEGADGSKMNPRNMSWQSDIKGWNPSPMEKDGEVLVDKDGNPRHRTRKGVIYGHYRTQTYVDYRKEIKRKEAEMDAVNSDWYSEQPDTAEPPMWQALYGNGDKLFEGVGDSLLTIVTDALEVEGVMDVLESTPIAIEGLGAAQAIFNELEPVREWFTRAVQDSSYRTSAGNFSATKARNFFLKNKVDLQDEGDSQLMLRIMESVNADYPVGVRSVYLAIPKNQINQIANMAGFQRNEEQEVTAQTQGMVEEAPDATTKMDWRTVLVR